MGTQRHLFGKQTEKDMGNIHKESGRLKESSYIRYCRLRSGEESTRNGLNTGQIITVEREVFFSG